MTKKTRFLTPVEERVAIALTQCLEAVENARCVCESPELITDIEVAMAMWRDWRLERLELLKRRGELATDARVISDQISAIEAELP